MMQNNNSESVFVVSLRYLITISYGLYVLAIWFTLLAIIGYRCYFLLELRLYFMIFLFTTDFVIDIVNDRSIIVQSVYKMSLALAGRQ